MKLLISTLLLIMSLINNKPKTVDINFIIMIDGELPIGTIARTHFKIQMIDGTAETIPFLYEPGFLRLNESDFKKINSDSVRSVTMLFVHYEEGSIEQGADKYEIDFDRRWFFERYTVLKLYDLKKKRYKKIFTPLKNRNYTFEVRTPNPLTSIIRIRNDRDQ